MSVDPKFHPKIIGRKGAVISQIRKDHDVSIQFPDKGDEQQVCVALSRTLKAPTHIVSSFLALYLNIHVHPSQGPDRDLGVRA